MGVPDHSARDTCARCWYFARFCGVDPGKQGPELVGSSNWSRARENARTDGFWKPHPNGGGLHRSRDAGIPLA